MSDAAVTQDLTFWPGFMASLSMILSCEIADKTFFIAAIMSTNYKGWVVFLGSATGLAVMTVLSVLVGTIAYKYVPPELTMLVASLLFLGFGSKAFYDAYKMDPNDSTEFEETQDFLERRNTVVSVADVENMIEARVKDPVMELEKKSAKPQKPPLSSNIAVFWQMFTMTFLAEWGDRSQIGTITLASANNPYGVCCGAVLACAICSAIAVVGGVLLSKKINPRTIGFIGAAVFVAFGAYGMYEMFQLDCTQEILENAPQNCTTPMEDLTARF